jgi:hypothetical protein
MTIHADYLLAKMLMPPNTPIVELNTAFAPAQSMIRYRSDIPIAIDMEDKNNELGSFLQGYLTSMWKHDKLPAETTMKLELWFKSPVLEMVYQGAEIGNQSVEKKKCKCIIQ